MTDDAHIGMLILAASLIFLASFLPRVLIGLFLFIMRKFHLTREYVVVSHV